MITSPKRLALLLTLPVIGLGLGLGACSSNSTGLPVDVPFVDTDSAAVKSVKNGSLQGCPQSSLGEMADAFFSDPEWSDFNSTTGAQVVELRGQMLLDNSPASALVQFEVDSLAGFEAVYLELNGISQNRLVLSVLLDKMCEAA